MSFATALALLIGVLVAAPVVAHLLRRGKTEERVFPPTRLVPAVVVTSQQRSHLEDLLLMALRALMVLALAVLGATPFVQCSDLSVERKDGASVAMVIVVDDSQSMRALTSEGESRFVLAKRGAQQLLQSARKGDAFSIVAAGHPARVISNASTDLAATRSALETLEVSDRSTDLSEAVALAASALEELPHVDKRIVLLSDLSVRQLASAQPAPWAPLDVLRQPVANCGVASARRETTGVLATVGCSNADAARDRKLEVIIANEPKQEALASAPLQALAGVQKVDVRVDGLGFELAVRLSGEDAIESDDLARVGRERSKLVIGLSADATKASAITGGPTVLGQALNALDPELDVHPLAGGLPETAEDLKRFAALIVDDPPGLSPEERSALIEWVEKGGVVLGLLGPSSTSTQLAASIEPFARDGAQWEARSPVGVDPKTVAWLGEDANSLQALVGGGRVRLDSADLPGTQILGAWEDGVPFLFRRELGRGVILTAGLPASLELSDFAVRPGFLALLDVIVERGSQAAGLEVTKAGVSWSFPGEGELVIQGPAGKERTELVGSSATTQRRATPGLAGRYEIELDGVRESRLVVIDTDELITAPIALEDLRSATATEGAASELDISPEWALLLLALFTLEMLLRVFGDRLKARVRVAS